MHDLQGQRVPQGILKKYPLLLPSTLLNPYPQGNNFNSFSVISGIFLHFSN